jgi:cell surface protein SprA
MLEKLNPNEYTYNAQLGYISLQQRLANDEVLAVAIEYTYRQAIRLGSLVTTADATVVTGTDFSGNCHSKFSFENAEK